MKIAISSGHGKYIRGASGSPVPPQLDEVDEARKVVEAVADIWRAMGIEVYVFHDDTSHDQGTNLDNIVQHHNDSFGGNGHDLDVSVHFNAYDSTAHGTEVEYLTQKALAQKVAQAIADVGFTLRADEGANFRDDLYFLNKTSEPAILIETCFCDNTDDSTVYRENFEAVCEAIAEAISGMQVPSEPDRPERPPVEPPERPDRPGRPEPEEENRFVMTLQCYGDMVVNINDQRFVAGDQPDNCPVINMTLAVPENADDLTISINGQDFHGPFEGAPPEHPPPLSEYPPNHSDIFATCFGGAKDNEHSAYGPYGHCDHCGQEGVGPYLNDTDLYVSLPTNVEDADDRERGVEVFYRPTGRKARGPVKDKGPWVINDDAYVFGDARPLAETCYNEDEPLPAGTGNNAGLIPANPAGIDLSPGMFKELGMDDNGPVDWKFVDLEVA